MRQQYLTVKAWRATNPEKYREYQRAYMAKRRGKVAPVAVKAPAETAAEKLARLLAAGRARVKSEPVAPEPEDGPALPYTIPPDGFDNLGPDRRSSWIERHWGDLRRHGELAGEYADERLSECRTATGRRKL